MQLTRKETVVYGLAARGYTTKYIAARLSLSPRTIDVHIRHIYEKTGVGSRDELIDHAERGRYEQHLAGYFQVA